MVGVTYLLFETQHEHSSQCYLSSATLCWCYTHVVYDYEIFQNWNDLFEKWKEKNVEGDYNTKKIRNLFYSILYFSFSRPSTTTAAYTVLTAGEADIEDPRQDILRLFEKWSRTGWKAGEAMIWRRQSQAFSFINSFISRIWNVVYAIFINLYLLFVYSLNKKSINISAHKRLFSLIPIEIRGNCEESEKKFLSKNEIVPRKYKLTLIPKWNDGKLYFSFREYPFQCTIHRMPFNTRPMSF